MDAEVQYRYGSRHLSTFALYRTKHPEGECEAMFDFVPGVYAGERAETIIDVWGEPEVFMRGT